MIALWLISLVTAFHLGWWLRHRLTQKVKAERRRVIDLSSRTVSPGMLAQINDAFWEYL